MAEDAAHGAKLGRGQCAIGAEAVKLKLVASRPSEKTDCVRIYGSPRFIGIGRNTELKSPTRFVATVKRDGDVII
jgi:hypothetical protein